jgi:hypothetical protein
MILAGGAEFNAGAARRRVRWRFFLEYWFLPGRHTGLYLGTVQISSGI